MFSVDSIWDYDVVCALACASEAKNKTTTTATILPGMVVLINMFEDTLYVAFVHQFDDYLLNYHLLDRITLSATGSE
jgi:hypothetical protein